MEDQILVTACPQGNHTIGKQEFFLSNLMTDERQRGSHEIRQTRA